MEQSPGVFCNFSKWYIIIYGQQGVYFVHRSSIGQIFEIFCNQKSTKFPFVIAFTFLPYTSFVFRTLSAMVVSKWNSYTQIDKPKFEII